MSGLYWPASPPPHSMQSCIGLLRNFIFVVLRNFHEMFSFCVSQKSKLKIYNRCRTDPLYEEAILPYSHLCLTLSVPRPRRMPYTSTFPRLEPPLSRTTTPVCSIYWGRTPLTRTLVTPRTTASDRGRWKICPKYAITFTSS